MNFIKISKFFVFLSILVNFSLLNSEPKFSEEDREVAMYNSLQPDEFGISSRIARKLWRDAKACLADNPEEAAVKFRIIFENHNIDNILRYQAALTLGLIYLGLDDLSSAYQWFNVNDQLFIEGHRYIGLYYENLADKENKHGNLTNALCYFQACLDSGYTQVTADIERVNAKITILLFL